MEYAHLCLGFFMEFSVHDSLYPLGQIIELLEEVGPSAAVTVK